MEAVQQRQYQRNAGNGQSLVDFPRLFRLFLARLLRHIEICEPYHSAQRKQRQHRHIHPAVESYGISDYCRQNAEAYGIAQRIYLYAEFFLVLRPVFLSPCNLAVEHIAESRHHKTDYGGCRTRLTSADSHCQENSHNGRSKAHICKNNRIVIETNHFNPLIEKREFV